MSTYGPFSLGRRDEPAAGCSASRAGGIEAVRGGTQWLLGSPTGVSIGVRHPGRRHPGAGAGRSASRSAGGGLLRALALAARHIQVGGIRARLGVQVGGVRPLLGVPGGELLGVYLGCQASTRRWYFQGSLVFGIEAGEAEHQAGWEYSAGWEQRFLIFGG